MLCELPRLIAKSRCLTVVHMQQKFALAGNVEAKAFSNGAVPRGAKLLVETLLDEARCRLVILPVLVEAHRNNLHSLVAHFRRHVRVLSN